MDNLQLSQGGSLCLNSAALAIAGTTSLIQTTAALNYVVDGQFYNKAATNNIPFSVALPATYGVATNGSFTGGANGSTRLYGIYVDKGGVFSYWPGPVVDSAALATGLAPLQFPANRKGRAFVGALRVAVASGVSFVPGTTALTGIGTFINCATVPGEPLTA